MKQYLRVKTVATLALAATLSVAAADVKRSLAGNRTLSFNVLPGAVDSFGDIFSQSEFYGRARTNFFWYDWDTEAASSRMDNGAMGVGASVVWRSAEWKGLSFGGAVYGTSSPFYREDRADVGLIKSGKDVLSRYEVARGGNYHFVVVGEAYAQYTLGNTQVRAGRQLFESVFTASNDTKMVPNTFDGVVLENSDLEKTQLRFAYFRRQKLRDHIDAHDVLTFRNAAGESWGNQDDAAVHKGLSYANLTAAGLDPDNSLWIATATNTLVPQLKVSVSALAVPDLLTDLVLEGHYTLKFGEWKVVPGARVFWQFDQGAGAIGGASLSGNVNNATPRGYSDPDNLDAMLWAARVVVGPQSGAYEWMLGYSDVADQADLVTPWRGFPTGGFTRAMAQYNWRANTRTLMLQGKFNLGKLGLLKGLNITARYAWQDFDERKGFRDSRVAHLDFTQKLDHWMPGLEARFRFGAVDDDGANDYNEYRLEFNYLF